MGSRRPVQKKNKKKKNTCNTIENHNTIHQYDLALEKYWVTQSSYFRLKTTVALGMGNIYGKLLLCHGISH